jgi:hypothetical protein
LAAVGILPSNAFYTSEINEEKVTDILAVVSVPKSSYRIPYILSIYRNTDISLYDFPPNLFVYEKSPQLVALIDLDISFVQPLLQREFIDSGQFLENLVYANLRIQNLIEQYRQLHQKARKLKLNQLASALDIGNKNVIRQKSYQSRLTKDGMRRTTTELIVELRNLGKVSQTTYNSGSFSPLETEIVADSVSSKTGITYFKYTDQRNQNDQSSAVSENEIRTNSGLNAQASINSQDGYKVGDSKRRTKGIEIPWIFKLFFSTVEYLMKNRIEAIIYLVILLLFISTFFGLRK